MPPRVRDDAVGAEVVAAVHRAYPGAVAAFAKDGHPLAYDSEFAVRLFAYERKPLFRAEHRFYYFRNAVVHIRPEHEIDVGIAFVDLLPPVRLLSHTAA